ncbi:MAG TPA: hypothetical protein VM051_12940 [Usitatibacter sp.]|nr:hypothetical protein [Usitatibacter sp.]
MKIGPRATLLLLASLFLLPIAASLTMYFFFPPPPSANYGELLLPPKAWPAALKRPSPDRWLLLATDDPGKVAAMQQVRLALGRNASRVEPVVARRADLSNAGLEIDDAHIYLVDPHGNVMMRWPAQPEMKRMLKDLERLLKASQIG